LSKQLNLVDNLLQNATRPTIDIISDFIQNSEPHGLLLLGQSDLIKTTPFFYTALRAFPQEICWPKKQEAVKYEFRLLNCNTNGWEIDPIVNEENHVDLTPQHAQLEQNTRYEWQVFVYEDGECPNNPWINGIFWVLSTESQGSLSADEESCKATSDLMPILLQATLYTEYELYEEVIQLLTSHIEPIKGSFTSIPIRRALSAAYRRAFDSCNGGVTPFWSAGYVNEILNEEVKQINCLDAGLKSGLNLYKTYQADGCEQCKQCGWIRNQGEEK
ncbi:MAG: hypothetical protein BWK78_03995, partial [Thiotrichaceae bacterium IS1]